MTSDAADAPTARDAALGAHFIRLGLAGFWIQLVLLILIFFLVAYVMALGGGQAQRYLNLGNWASFLSLGLPVFTTWWARRYAGLGRQLQGVERRPSPRLLRSKLWIGVWVGVFGGVLSLLMLYGAVTNLLYVLVTAPQVGLLISPTAPTEGALSISAIDAVSLLSLLLTLTTELLVIALSLRLLFLTGFEARA